MEQIARVYAKALFEVAKEKGKLDEIRDQLGQFADAVAESRELQLFLFSPYFSSTEKRDGVARALSGAEPELVNFLELLAEKHRMPTIFRIRQRFDDLWAQENRQLEVTLTSAVELDADVDDQIIGGLVLRVGNMVLDASVRSKLERLRKEVAQAA